MEDDFNRAILRLRSSSLSLSEESIFFDFFLGRTGEESEDGSCSLVGPGSGERCRDGGWLIEPGECISGALPLPFVAVGGLSSLSVDCSVADELFATAF